MCPSWVIKRLTDPLAERPQHLQQQTCRTGEPTALIVRISSRPFSNRHFEVKHSGRLENRDPGQGIMASLQKLKMGQNSQKSEMVARDAHAPWRGGEDGKKADTDPAPEARGDQAP